ITPKMYTLQEAGTLTTTLVASIIVFTVMLTPPLAQSAPQYPGTFIKTNHSSTRHHGLPGEGHNRNGAAHRERHSVTQVQTSTGLLHGIRRNVLGKDVHIYLGVPFAQPPLGPLRFKKPISLKPWNGTYYATKQPNTCYQEHFVSFPEFRGEMMWNPNTNISEDCLYLNMWVPKTRKTNMPILIWIYGGGYMAGTSTLDIYNGEILAAENSVIVVGIQYRVGSFGFLYYGNEDAPGNVGLWDQLSAMKWAGGGSVSFHLLSPYSRDYMTRGIIQSGTLNAPWSIMDAPTAKAIAKKLANDCNCTEATEADTLQCLRDLPAQRISELQWESYSPILNFPSAPTIDGKFLPKHPIDMLKEGDFKKAELLIGSNLNEGTYFILYDYIKYFDKEGPNCLPRETFLEILDNVFGNLSSVQKDAIRFQYTHWEEPKDPCKVTEKFADLVGDYYFICPTNKFAELYAEHNAPVYYYFFTQRTSLNPWGKWMGVMHADEIEYVFGNPLNGTAHTREEKDLSRRIMKYFTTFAETGRPVSEDSGEDWPLYTKAEPNYFILNSKDRGTGKGPRAHTCAFWNEFMPVITTGTSSRKPQILRFPHLFGMSYMTFLVDAKKIDGERVKDQLFISGRP
ncbi:Acetylcholinesterase, partial [Orchesella cincta]